jgi:hypothetical protein
MMQKYILDATPALVSRGLMQGDHRNDNDRGTLEKAPGYPSESVPNGSPNRDVERECAYIRDNSSRWASLRPSGLTLGYDAVSLLGGIANRLSDVSVERHRMRRVRYVWDEPPMENEG